MFASFTPPRTIKETSDITRFPVDFLNYLLDENIIKQKDFAGTMIIDNISISDYQSTFQYDKNKCKPHQQAGYIKSSELSEFLEEYDIF